MPSLPSEPQVTPQLPQDDPTSLLPKKLARARPLFDPRNRAAGNRGFFRQAESGHAC